MQKECNLQFDSCILSSLEGGSEMWQRLLSLFIVVAMGACAGGDGSSYGGTPGDDTAGRGDVAADAPGPGDLADIETGGECAAPLVLELFNAESPMVLEVDREYTIQARVYNPVIADTPEGEAVSFALTGEGDAQFTETSADSDGFGVASVTLSTGTQSPATYGLHIDTPCAEGIDVALDVQPHATGTILLTITVGAAVQDPGKIASFGVYVSHAAMLCAATDPTDPAPEMVLTTLDAGNSQLLMEDAVAGPGYTIMVVGYDDTGLPLAAGCGEGISVFADKETSVEVTLGPLQISPAGTYQLTLTPDFGALTAGQAPGWSAALAAGLDAVDDDVKIAVLEGILVWMDDGVIPEHCDDVGLEIDASVEAWVADNMPPAWAAGLVDLEAPLMDLLEDPEVGVSLNIVGGGFGGDCAATLDIKSVRFDGAGGAVEFLEDQFETGEAWLKAEDSEVTCEVTSENKLLFHEFGLHVNPGRFLLFAFVNVVLPDVADGATSVMDLFTGHFDCAEMLAGVQQSTLTCINRPMSELVADCEDAVFAALDDYLGLAAIPAAEQMLQVSASAAMVDDDKDLAADALDGEFTGAWILDGADMGPVTVPFSGPKL